MVFSTSFNFNVTKHRARILTLKAGTTLMVLSEFSCDLFGSKSAILKEAPLEMSASACHWGKKREKTPNVHGLCQHGDPRHNLISRSTSEVTLQQHH